MFFVQVLIPFSSYYIPKVKLDLFGTISISSKMPSARRKRLLARRSREEGFSSEDENSNVVLRNQNQTFTSDMPEQNVNDENFPNSVSSVSNHEIRPNKPLRDMTNDENRIREIIRAETENSVNIAENMRILSDELNNRISTEMESLFENLNDRMQRMIKRALNARNTAEGHQVQKWKTVNIVRLQLQNVTGIKGPCPGIYTVCKVAMIFDLIT